MKKINKDFNIPYYIVEELLESRCNPMKVDNLKLLIRMAVFNNKLSKEQGEFLENTYCN